VPGQWSRTRSQFFVARTRPDRQHGDISRRFGVDRIRQDRRTLAVGDQRRGTRRVQHGAIVHGADADGGRFEIGAIAFGA
jgi:hypothetical protein